MAVPAHDERDFEFAKTFGIPIRQVVQAHAPAECVSGPIGECALGPKGRDTKAQGKATNGSDVLGSNDQMAASPEGAKLRSAAPSGLTASTPEDPGRRGSAQADPLCPGLSSPGPSGQSDEAHLSSDQQPNTAFTELGVAINSGKYSGLATLEFKSKITADLAASGLGRKAVNYRLRDWLFSRQRYWGEPFPLWHELDANGQPTGLLRVDAESALPITLPEMADFKPTGTPEPMLSKAPESWLYKTAPDGTKLKRETNTMPQWAGSCWYYLRFVDNKNRVAFIDPQLEQQWLPIDLYVGGAEHAVLHLLYSRFWHKVLFDRGHVHTAEPFQRLVNQGMILGEVEFATYEPKFVGYAEGKAQQSYDRRGADEDELRRGLNKKLNWVSVENVIEESDGSLTNKLTGEKLARVILQPQSAKKIGDLFVLEDHPHIRIESRAFKMSKSRGNVINPDKVVDEYGADSLRLYEMFMGPLEAVKPWSMQGVEGVFRFLSRVWRTITDDRADDVRLNSAVQDVPPTEPQLRLLHKTIKAVTHDFETLGFNTSISRLMEFMNEVTNWNVRPISILRPFVLLLSPLAPHIAEELWQLLAGVPPLGGEPAKAGTPTLAYEPWPTFDPKLVEDSVIDVPVQINGKLRAKITVAAKADQTAIEEAARREDSIVAQLEGKTVVKVVYVPGRMLNFVVK